MKRSGSMKRLLSVVNAVGVQVGRIAVRIALLALSCLAAAHAQGIISPASPVAFEQVSVTIICIDLESCVGASVSMTGGIITVTAVTSQCAVCGYPHRLPVQIGRFPAGTYTVNVVEHGVTRAQQFTVTDPNQGTSPPLAQPLVDYTDQWWDPDEPGWGIAITQHPNGALFAVWAVYGPDNRPVWYSLQGGQWNSPYFGAYTGSVYRTTGPYFGGRYADGPAVAESRVGTATLTFDDIAAGRLQFSVDGVAGSKAISRLNF